MSDLSKIREHLASKPRDLLLLEIALQTQVPVHDILQLRIEDLQGLEIGDPLPFKSTLKDGTSESRLNEKIHSAFRKFTSQTKPQSSDFLFKSRKGGQPLSIPSVSRIIKGWRKTSGVTDINGLPGLRLAGKKEREKAGAASLRSLHQNGTLLPKIKSKTIQEKVYSELENAIISGRIAPGQKLGTEEIAKMMDVSRIPVREAMGRLEARGFITTRPKWGSVVNELSRKNLQEISGIRLLLEPQAAVKAVEFADDDFLVNLERYQEEFAKIRMTSDTKELLRSNRKFHFLIYQQSSSPILLNLIKQMWDKVSPYYHIMFAQSLEKSPKVGVSYHEKIVESFKVRDAEAVYQWIHADLVDSTDYILKLFDQTKMEIQAG